MQSLIRTCLALVISQVLYLPVSQAGELSVSKLDELLDRMRNQEQELAAQRSLLKEQNAAIAEQNQLIDGLRTELDSWRGHTLKVTHIAAAKPVENPVLANSRSATVGAGALAKIETEQQTDKMLAAQQDDPTRHALEDFSGSLRLPGTSAAIRFGGYVKTSGVYNFDPLESQDRFIVGTIPPDDVVTTIAEEATITVSQSRLNFELREPTSAGLMRAFVEGDFAGDNDTFRLRHAFGQYRRLLAGKTWTAFGDAESRPEEIDFEGLNAQINVRQAQLRYSPHFGEDYQFQFSMEDPNPAVKNGEGVSLMPDLIASVRIASTAQRHLKLALVLRQVRAQWDEGGGITEEEFGGGLSLSARHVLPWADPRDNVLLQLNVGRGIGRYINDLNTVGDFDGVFNPATGELELLDVAAGYISGQHWWGPTLRSNLTVGMVYVDQPNFADERSYEHTIRTSTNLLWSPMPRLLLGGEFLWGSRENVDGSSGDASQLQLAAKYRF